MRQTKATPNVVQHFRYSHHCIAQMYAAGMNYKEIHLRTGFTPRRLTLLEADPSFQQLIIHYANKAMEDRQDVVNEYSEIADHNALTAQHMLRDKLDSAYDSDELPSIRDLLAISKNRDARHLKPGDTNINLTLAVALDRALERSSKVMQIEHKPQIQIERVGAPEPKLVGQASQEPLPSLPSTLKRI